MNLRSFSNVAMMLGAYATWVLARTGRLPMPGDAIVLQGGNNVKRLLGFEP